MGKTAILAIKFLGDSRGAIRSTEAASSSIGKFEKGLNKVTPAATVAAGGFLAFASVTSAAAGEAEQNIGAVNTVFGESAQKIHGWADAADSAVGLSASAYSSLAASIGGSLRTAGYSMDETASKTNDMINAAADLSSVFGGTTAEASGAMGAALRGEFDSLERFGVFMNMTAVNARLAAAGQDKLTGSALDAAKKQMVNNMIMEQAGQYSGNFAREADTAAGAQQRAAAATEDAKAALGQGFLPVIVAGSRALQGFAGFAQQNAGLVTTLAAVVGGLGAVVLITNGAMKAWAAASTLVKAAQVGVTAGQWLLNAAMAANPIGLVIAVVAGLVLVFILAYNKFAWFRNGVNAVWGGVKALFTGGVNFIKNIFANPGGMLAGAGRAIMNGLWRGIAAGFEKVKGFVSGIGPWIAAHKGPISYDKVLLKPAGAAIMGGLVGSMRAQMPALQSMVDDATGTILSIGTGTRGTALRIATGGAGAANGSRTAEPVPTVVYNFTINGALDSRGVAKQIKEIMATYDRSRGKIVNGVG